MSKQTALLILFLGFCPVLLAHPALDVMDELRLGNPDQEVKVMTEIRLYKKGELESQRDYEVYVGSNRRSLVLFRSQAEAGQKMLMLDDQYWLFMPSSRRPLRITPMQKLLGEASSGDLSSLRWKDDYTVISEKQEGQKRVLELEAARSGVTYTRVELLVDSDSLHPQQADFYLQSGRLAREAEFMLEERQGRPVISGMKLQDRIQTNEQTLILYHSSEPVDIPERWFNPAFLSRETL
ncbi:outer membrane lipoprotein-sorting protein [Marinospirillum sp.]|uniref:outer membrane lipoprotein-sorting protein n=1 Tax=Marinospirillum sp. TaxID=2183934 RepID=UPI0038507E8A